VPLDDKSVTVRYPLKVVILAVYAKPIGTLISAQMQTLIANIFGMDSGINKSTSSGSVV